MNPMMNAQAGGPEGSLMGVAGSTQAGNNLTLKGWPLTGIDPIRFQQKSMMQSSQPFHQMQQQLLLQAQRSLASPSAIDMENRKLRILMGNRSMGLGKDGQLNTMGEVVPNVGLPGQLGGPVLPRSNSDMLMKQQLQNNNQVPPQNPQSSLSGHQPQIPNQLHPPDKMVSTGSMSMDGSMSNSFRGNEQTSKSQMGWKRKQPVSSSGPANSTGTANTGPSPGSQPSTPSTHSPGDVMSMSNLQHNGVSSKPSMTTFGSDTLPSAPNQLLLATGGRDKKVVLWYADTQKLKSTLEEHTHPIRDVRFSPSMARLATSSYDRTVRVWDAVMLILFPSKQRRSHMLMR